MIKTICLFAFATLMIAACAQSTPVMKIDDLWVEREKSKSDFHKKYAGKDIVVAGVYKDGKPELDFKKGYSEINIHGSSLQMIHCQVEERDSAAFKDLAGKGEGIAVRGKLVSGENYAYPELRPCTLDVKK